MKVFLYMYFQEQQQLLSKAYHVMTNSSGNQPSKSLLCDIMMYKNKDTV
jgi:hypothetical protein